ncbi:hypothetical protein XZ45_15310 [Salmonella enterica subsp. enterica]|uniref:hypothetical protein n=1 Tax=Salmonella enterica TaxID=28901 RepID=UPI00097351B7|nr:hypothetical protein [Salmonella enterica]APY61127.1 hypothetical protein LFZ14_18700 [Salmonella enterica subsp. enterica serovar Hillingdon str. N1529-D3]EBG8069933.1 hypothetical protein [Salmonella enterica subsp. enterica serovar Elisabethville]EBV1891651.1 hypothetical protein [Salmonella enterica subsp. enterica serovar Coquilhatville]ECE0384374.1 hypothetical protein [Salmonella enterica subsp. enterica serovar Aba]EAA8604923.1 hypothetical protein [Salmonella enterica]
MAIQFRPTEHVITDDGEWVAVDELSYLHARPLLCGSCHTPVIVVQAGIWSIDHVQRQTGSR